MALVLRRLVHVCCANCLSDGEEAFAEDGAELTLLFANPNIHPLVEFRRRRKSVRLLAERLGLALEEEPYGLGTFLDATAGARGRDEGRCRTCYAMRLKRTAARANEHGAASFSTPLRVSRRPDREAGGAAGERAASAHGVEFAAPDLRDLHGSDRARPRDLKLYRQSYCGCVFSEEERFRETSRGE